MSLPGKNSRRAFVVAAALGSALCVGAVVATASDAPAPGEKVPAVPGGPPHKYPVNARGETYGSGLDATSPENEPDLIEAMGEGGIRGYVRAEDLEGDLPANPAEALEAQRNTPKVRRIPLYGVDGTTVIGSFTVHAGTTPTTTAK